jgi:hypothetical protein
MVGLSHKLMDTCNLFQQLCAVKLYLIFKPKVLESLKVKRFQGIFAFNTLRMSPVHE